jgi:ParB/RepB/Spo0J family partition protein
MTVPADLASSPAITGKVQMPNTFNPASLDKLRSAQAVAQTSRPVMGEQYREVLLTAVMRDSPIQSRAALDPENDDEDRALVESIEASGQREPAHLAEIEGSCPPEYAILDGHRRIAALRHLKRETVKAIIVRQGSQECDLISLTANVRKNLTPLELARSVGGCANGTK